MAGETRYIGLLTRTVAFAIDAAVLNVVALLVSTGAALILSLFTVGHDVKTVLIAIGGVVYVLWVIGYFVGFWSVAGETPGNRFMRIRVTSSDGGRVGVVQAVLRCVCLLLSALALFIPLLLILFDSRRRALHDVVARTVVVESPTLSLAAVRRERRRADRGLRSSHSGDEPRASVSQA
jgi:uncharacterized RDD family membrane protein YckC